MDCPNCGAYNASSSTRCRRCNQPLPGAEEQAAEDWTAEADDQYEIGGSSRSSESAPEDVDTGGEVGTPGPHDSWELESSPETPSYGSQDPSWSSRPASYGEYGSSGGGYQSTSTWESGGSAGASYGPPPDIPNYLWQSIVVTFCCCLPLGIPAIVFASRVNPFVESGDYEHAQEQSQKAKNWTLAAFIAGLLWVFCWFGYIVLAGGATVTAG